MTNIIPELGFKKIFKIYPSSLIYELIIFDDFYGYTATFGLDHPRIDKNSNDVLSGSHSGKYLVLYKKGGDNDVYTVIDMSEALIDPDNSTLYVLPGNKIVYNTFKF